MLCVLSALKAESDPIINFFKLKKDSSFKFPVFIGEDIGLIGLGVGSRNISSRINIFFKKFKKENIFFINIGVAGGSSIDTKIGEAFIINKINDDFSKKSYYPDILIKHLFKEKDITTVQNIVSNNSGHYNSLIDMESSMIFDTCKNLVSPHQISFIKIVSDYFNMNNQSFDSNYIKKLINNSINKIEKYFINLKLLNNKEVSILTIEDNVWLDNISNILSLTASQKQFIKHKAMGYRIKNPFKCLPNDKIGVPISKLNQKKILKKLSDKISI